MRVPLQPINRSLFTPLLLQRQPVSSLRALHQRNPAPIYVLSHADCGDGLASAVAFADHASRSFLLDDCQFHEVAYGQPIPAAIDPAQGAARGYVFILDFSYSPEVLAQLCNHHYLVMVVDHHKTALESLKPFFSVAPMNFYYYLVEEPTGDCTGASGCLLTHDLGSLFGSEAHASGMGSNNQIFDYFIALVARHDLFQHEGDINDPAYALSTFIAHYRKYKKTFAEIDFGSSYDLIVLGVLARLCADTTTADLFLRDMLKEGSNLLKAVKNQLDVDILPLAKEYNTGRFGGFTFCPCPAHLASIAGAALVDPASFPFAGFSLTYARLPDGRFKYSLRSRRGSRLCRDVDTVAAFFGGGGHRHASGFISSSQPEEILALLQEHTP